MCGQNAVRGHVPSNHAALNAARLARTEHAQTHRSMRLHAAAPASIVRDHVGFPLRRLVFLVSQANPHVLLGALLEGPADGTDSFPNVRTDNGSQVAVENNAGFATAMVATYQTTKPSWPECLQGFGFFRKVCPMSPVLPPPSCMHMWSCAFELPAASLDLTTVHSVHVCSHHGINCVTTRFMSVAGSRLLISLRACRHAAA